MTKKEFLNKIKNFPEDAELRVDGNGACYEWTPTNTYYRKEEGKIYIRNFTNKESKSRWG